MCNLCREFKIITIVVMFMALVGAAYNLTSEIQANRCKASAGSWFQEIEQVKNLISEKRFLPSHSQMAFTSDTVYRDTHIPTGPPKPSYVVGDLKNFGLANSEKK